MAVKVAKCHRCGVNATRSVRVWLGPGTSLVGACMSHVDNMEYVAALGRKENPAGPRFIVRTHESYMPGQGPRGRFSETVVNDRETADTMAARLNGRHDGTWSHVVTVIGDRTANGNPYPVR